MNHASLSTTLVTSPQRLAIKANQLALSQRKRGIHPPQKTLLEWRRAQTGKQTLNGVVRRYPMG